MHQFTRDDGVPVIGFSTLMPDGHNIPDKTFEAAVHRFMDQYMPGGPMGLLSTNYERWQVQPDRVHAVRQIGLETEGPDPKCSECEGTGHSNTPPDGGPCSCDPHTLTFYAIENTDTDEWVVNEGYGHYAGVDAYDEVTYGGTANVFIWKEYDEAKDVLEQLDQSYDSEHGHENRLAIPWGHSYWRMPDSIVKNDDLHWAGWSVATYIGGEGNWQEDEEFRMAGMDVVGMSHLSWWARLYVKVADRYCWRVLTDKGEVYVEIDERPDLVKLSDVGEGV